MIKLKINGAYCYCNDNKVPVIMIKYNSQYKEWELYAFGGRIKQFKKVKDAKNYAVSIFDNAVKTEG